MPRPPSSSNGARLIGDALSTLAALQPTTDSARAEVLALLGLRAVGQIAPRTPLPPEPAPATAPNKPQRPPAPKTAPPDPEVRETRTALTSYMETLTQQDGIAAPDWLHDVAPLAKDGAILPAYRKPLASLMDPRRTRALLTQMLSQPVQNGPIDTAKLVSRIARVQPLHSLPRRMRTTTAPGVQLLLDQSKVMAPFALDVQHLAHLVASVAGHAGTEIAYFSDDPDHGVMSAATGLTTGYLPPLTGTPVLAATLLYAKPAASSHQIAQWQRFAGRLAARRCELVLLAVGAQSALADARKAGLTVLPWDRTLSVQALARRLAPR